jgi:putative acetyltransferase
LIEIRAEETQDADAVREIHDRAFGRPHEGRVVDRLRAGCHDLLSLVAVDGERVVGHILFSPATIECGGCSIRGMGLAPVAVLPEVQCRGVGSGLIREGIARLKAQGCPFVIVLGHPSYYPRFGFERASRHGIRSDWQVPDEAFMIRILDDTGMTGASGVCRYRSEFDGAV